MLELSLCTTAIRSVQSRPRLLAAPVGADAADKHAAAQAPPQKQEGPP